MVTVTENRESFSKNTKKQHNGVMIKIKLIWQINKKKRETKKEKKQHTMCISYVHM